jgi:hypothetical protein
MKPVRSALLFVISVVVFSACFNPPEYNNVPNIEFEGVSFSKSPNGQDSLVVSVSFKDGDGDLGLSANSGPDTESPYHEINFFSNDNGALYPINGIRIENFSGYTYKKAKTTPRDPSYYIEPEKATAELITLQSRNDGFTLPAFTPPYDCFLNEESYLNERQNPDTIFIFRENSYLIKDKMTIVDTLVRNGDPNEYYFVVVDYFYIKTNPYQYNFKVQFFVKNNDGSFSEFDFRREYCETHDGRFPRLTDKDRALEGVINYSMVSSGFLATFSIKTLKLAITIYDRALNTSNTVETPEFRLEEI